MSGTVCANICSGRKPSPSSAFPARSVRFTICREISVYVACLFLSLFVRSFVCSFVRSLVCCLLVCLFVCLFVHLFVCLFEVVPFHGRCMLSILFLPAFISLGHPCPNHLSLRDGMHICTDLTSVYTPTRKSCMRVESKPMLVNPKGKIPSTDRLQGEWTAQDSESNALPAELFRIPTSPPSHPLPSSLTSLRMSQV